jgi:hypothetical protein
MSIPSLISIFKIGRLDYIRNIKLLYKLRKKINLCYKVSVKKVRHYSINAVSHTQNVVDEEYYFPVYVNDERVFIVNKAGKGIWYRLSINVAKYDGVNWQTDLVEIKTSTCMFTQVLNDRFQKKLDRLIESSTLLDDVDDLNQLINSEIVSIRRDSKLNQII